MSIARLVETDRPATTTAAVQTAPFPTTIPQQADSDAHLVKLWLHGRPATTTSLYEMFSRRFFAYMQKPLQRVTLDDLQTFADSLSGMSANGQATVLRTIKSLFSFGFKLGYLPFNVAAVVRTPPTPELLHERFLSEEEVRSILEAERDPRNHAMIQLLYIGGLRVRELVSLKWRHLQAMGDGGLAIVTGKRSKVRAVPIPAAAWREIMALRGGAAGEDPVFRSGKTGGHLTPHGGWRLVVEAAERAGIERPVSPHWLRHAHISHALDHGAPLHVVMASVGHSNLATTGKYAHARPGDGSGKYLPETGGWTGQGPAALDGAAIKAERLARGLTQAEAARQMGLHQTYLSQIERGHIVPTRAAGAKVREWLAR